MRNFGFLGPGNHSGPLGKCFGRRKIFFEKNCFFQVIFGPFWGLLGPKWAQMSKGPISWFWGLQTIWDVFLSKKFFLKKNFFCPKMAQNDLEKFQTPATAFRGENGPGGPKTPKSGPFCGGFGTNGSVCGQKCVILGFWGLETIQNYSGSVLVENFFFEKIVFFKKKLFFFKSFLGHFGALMGPNGGSRGPISWFWGLKTIWDVFLSKKIFLEKNFLAKNGPKGKISDPCHSVPGGKRPRRPKNG